MRRRIGHHYTKKSEKQPEQKTLEVTVIYFMALEEFVDEKGKIPQVVPDNKFRMIFYFVELLIL